MTTYNSDSGRQTSFQFVTSKMEGIIDVSLYTKLKYSIFSLFAYFDTLEYFQPVVHGIVGAFRLFQLFIPVLMIDNSKIWSQDSNSYKNAAMVVTFGSFFGLSRDKSSNNLALIVYCAVFAIMYAVLFIACAFFRKNLFLNRFFSMFIITFYSTLGIILHPMIMSQLSSFIWNCINDQTIFLISSLFIILLTIFVLTIYIWLLNRVINESILFRPSSLQTLLSFPQTLIFVQTLSISFISSFISHMDKNLLICGIVIMVVLYLSGVFIVFRLPSFINSKNSRNYLAVIISSVLSLSISIVALVFNKFFNEIMIISVVLIILVAFIVATHIINNKNMSDLSSLDLIDENINHIEMISNTSKILNIILTGFMYNHPACVSWALFRAAIDRWGESSDLWVSFSKFVAIYPSESDVLSHISQSIVTHRVKGHSARMFVFFIKSIIKKREINISPELKSRLAKAQKSISKSKQRIRNVWDLLLQGSVSEMDSSSECAFSSVLSTEREIRQLIEQYPNSRFVLRVFSRYLLDIRADIEGYNNLLDNVRLLKRGHHVSKDIAQVLGLHAFPNIPRELNLPRDGLSIQNPIEQSSAFETETDIEDESSSKISSVLKEVIKSHRVPASKCITSTTLLITTLFIVLPFVFLITYFWIFIDDITVPLDYLYAISYMRSLNFQLASFLSRLMLEKLPHPTLNDTLCRVPSLNHLNLFSLGRESDTTKQIRFLLREVMEASKKLSPLRKYHLDSQLLSETRRIMFDNSVPFKYYMNSTNIYQSNISAESFVIRSANQLSRLIEDKISNYSLITSYYLTVMNNLEFPGQFMTKSLEYAIEYLRQNDLIVQNRFSYITYGFILSSILIFLVCFWVELHLMNKNKKVLFSSMTYLPKNVLSSVSASFKILSKDSDVSSKSIDSDGELSKQEDNMLKVFSKIGDGGSKYIGTGFLFLSYIVILICCSASWIILSYLFLNKSTTLIESAPHLDSILGSYAYMNQLFSSLNTIVLYYSGYPQVHNDPFSLLEKISDSKKKILSFYHLARFGGQNNREFPFSGIFDALTEASKLSGCSDQFAVPASAWGYYTCFNADFQVYLFNVLLSRLTKPFEENISFILPRGQFLSETWVIGIISLYDQYFYPMFTSIIGSINSEMRVNVNLSIMISTILLIIALIFVGVILNINTHEEKRLKFSLELLYHCPNNAIQQCPHLMQVLAGKYERNTIQTTERGINFYDTVINHLMDLLIVLDNENRIIRVNQAFSEILKDSLFLNMDIAGVFSTIGFKGNVLEMLTSNDNVQISLTEKDGSTRVFSFIRTVIIDNTVLVGRDISVMIKYSNLIADESNKIDSMLSSILPKVLVKRVQSGEKHISFLAQSSSIVFIDIVEFTPWCANNTAIRVMEILNAVFKDFDLLIQSLPSMTKIKCIGDCYMAAGGIFMETNQPSIHSKEAVQFGIEAINCIRNINNKYGENLKIRVGVHTGGPIVAGVIGTGKPTFELFGLPITIAQKAEHGGVPMTVHITRTVYEYIYDLNYKISEKGEFEFENYKMLTYLVSQ